jgi:hypothetical protein
VLIISVIFLLSALLEGWAHGFFALLRCVVFGSSAYLTWLAYNHEKGDWCWIFGFIALLFNPIIPVYLYRELWVSIDFLVAVFLIISVFAFKLPEESENESYMHNHNREDKI